MYVNTDHEKTHGIRISGSNSSITECETIPESAQKELLHSLLKNYYNELSKNSLVSIVTLHEISYYDKDGNFKKKEQIEMLPYLLNAIRKLSQTNE